MRFIEGSRWVPKVADAAKAVGKKALYISPFGLIPIGLYAAEMLRPNPNPGYDGSLENCNVPALTRLGAHDQIERKTGDKVLIAGIDVNIRSGGQILVDPRDLNESVSFDSQGDLNIQTKGRFTEVLATAGANPIDTKLDVYCINIPEEKPAPEPTYGPEPEFTPVS